LIKFFKFVKTKEFEKILNKGGEVINKK